MDIIANTGIQMFVQRVSINLNQIGRNMFFREWFDENAVQWKVQVAFKLTNGDGGCRYVNFSELEDGNFVDGRSRQLLRSKHVVNAQPFVEIENEEVKELTNRDRDSIIKQLFDRWLPAPYLEIDPTGGNHYYKKTPYNWCRCKIVPVDGHVDNTQPIKCDVLFAFDT